METTRIKKTDLLDQLTANREAHKTEFQEALKDWKKKSTKALKKAAKKAEEKGVITLLPLEGLPKPTHYLDSYDVVIKRLQMEVEDTVHLEDREFQSWVMNNWDWAGRFTATTSLYNNHRE